MTTRKQDEEYVDYMKRITRMCADKQISYSEMGDALLGDLNCYSAENLRKAFYVLEKICNIINNEIIKDFKEDPKISKEIEKLEKLKDEVYKERCKLADLNRVHRTTLREEARFETLLEVMKTEMRNLEPIEIEDCKPQTDNKRVTGILQISDLHIGKLIDNQWYIYNNKIAKKRLNTIINKAIEKSEINKVTDLIS